MLLGFLLLVLLVTPIGPLTVLLCTVVATEYAEPHLAKPVHGAITIVTVAAMLRLVWLYMHKTIYVATTGKMARLRRALSRQAIETTSQFTFHCYAKHSRAIRQILQFLPKYVGPTGPKICIEMTLLVLSECAKNIYPMLKGCLRKLNWRKTYNWKFLMLILLCIAGITPIDSMDQTPGSHHAGTPGNSAANTPASISINRLRLLQQMTRNSERAERRRRIRSEQLQADMLSGGGADTEPEPDVPTIQPMILDPLFERSNTIFQFPQVYSQRELEWRRNFPDSLEPANDRIGAALRQRDGREFRRLRGPHEQTMARQRLMRSFTSEQVPSAEDLRLLSESDPDAALLLFHETGGQWRFNCPEIIGVSDECPQKLDSDLEAEVCSPHSMTQLINNSQKRLGNLNSIFACGCCGVKRIVAEDVDENEASQFPRVSLEDPMLGVLRLSPEAETKYQELGEYRRAISAWPQTREIGDGQRFWLHPELVEESVDGSFVRLCMPCHNKLSGTRQRNSNRSVQLPELSIANGVDFGNPDRLGLPELTLVEMYLLAPVRLYGSVIKLKPFEKEGDVRVLNGHIIAFQQLSAAAFADIQNGLIRYPRLDDVRKLVSVSFLGERGQLDRMLNGGDHKIPRDLTVRPDAVYKWLDALSILNPDLFPHNNIDQRTETIESHMRELTQQLLAESLCIDAIGRQMNEELESDTARVRFGTQQQVDDISEAFEQRQDPDAARPAMAASMLRGNADTFPGENTGVRETADILHTMRGVVSGCNDGNRGLQINREQMPINEFTDNKRLILGAFPTLFLLGKGMNYAGSVPQHVAEHMILQFHGHFARNRWLLFTLMNQNMRHSAARAVSAAVNAHPEAGAELAELCASEDFKRQLDEHFENPNTSAAKALAKKCRKFIQMAGAKVPYSPAERNQALSKMYSMTYRFGIPSVFLTIAPDDIGSPLVLRWAMHFKGNSAFPSAGNTYGNDFGAFFEAVTRGDTSFMEIPIANEHQNTRLKKLVTDNPVAAALVYQQIMDVVLEELLGISPEHKIRKTVPLQGRPKGIFGTTTATFAVTETQARHTLHGHLAIWGSIPPALMQKAAHNRNITGKIATVLDSYYTAQLPPSVHVKGMLNRIAKSTKRPVRMPVITPTQLGLQRFTINTAEKADFVGVHRHTFTCHKGKHGEFGCRVSQPSGLSEQTGPVLVTWATQENRTGITDARPLASEVTAPEDATFRGNRNRRTCPIPEVDTRCIVWEMMRPQLNADAVIDRLDPDIKASIDGLSEDMKTILRKSLEVRNGAVVSFSPVLTQCLGCNTAAYLLGSEEQARAALFYLVKYMNKDSVALSNSLPVIRQAMIHVNQYPSVAADVGSISRTGKYFLERIVNGFTGVAEISDTQSAACLLGMKSYLSTEQHWIMWIHGATAHQLESQLRSQAERDPHVAWEDDSDFEAHSADDRGAESSDEDILPNRGFVETEDCAEEHVARGRGKYGRAQIFRVGDRVVPIPQHVHYRYRGQQLARLNFYEWCAIISIQTLDTSEADVQAQQRHPPQRGAQRRPRNSTFPFAEGHPLQATHVQKIRSKLQCPILGGGPPPKYPGPNIGARSAQWKKKANAYARYMLTAFNPWDINNGSAWDYSTSVWDCFCAMCNRLDPEPGSSPATFIEKCRFAVICNVTRALKVDKERKKLLTAHRCRAVKPWNSSTPDYACDFENLIHGQEANEEGPADSETRRTAREEIDRLMRLQNSDEPNRRVKGHEFVATTIACLDAMFPVGAATEPANHAQGQGVPNIVYQCGESLLSNTISDIINTINSDEESDMQDSSSNPQCWNNNSDDAEVWREIETLLRGMDNTELMQCKQAISADRISDLRWANHLEAAVERSNLIKAKRRTAKTARPTYEQFPCKVCRECCNKEWSTAGALSHTRWPRCRKDVLCKVSLEEIG